MSLEHSGVRGDRRTIVNERIAKMYRAHVALLTFGAWLSISNHCAVGALIASQDQSAMAPMHCHSEQPAPSKKAATRRCRAARCCARRLPLELTSSTIRPRFFFRLQNGLLPN